MLEPLSPETLRQIDTTVEGVRDEQHLPGVALALVRDGQMVKASGYGWASLELDVPVTPNTVFAIGSLTKQFTATLIQQLAEAGLLTLNDSIVPFIASYLNGKPAPEGWKAITLRHLLSHTSGLKRDAVLFRPTENTLPPDYIPVLYRWGRQEFTPSELVQQLAALPLDFAPPGAKMSYSNAGYYLLGLVIEKVSGVSYGDCLRQRILQPLGMTATRLIDDDLIPHRATGYTWNGSEWRHGGYVNPSRDHAAGSLVSTVGDLARWDAAWNGDRLLPLSRLDELWTPSTLNDGTPLPYGLGWSVTTAERINDFPSTVVGHGGMWGGFTAHWARFLDERLTVIALTNLGISGRCPDGGISGKPAVLTRHIAEVLLPDLAPLP